MRRYFVLLVLQLIPLLLFPQKVLTVEEQLKDLVQLDSMLKLVHPSLYRYSTKTQLDSIYSVIKESIDKPITCEKFSELIDPIFYLIKDAHTWKQLVQNSGRS